jgi:hypothetical protein
VTRIEADAVLGLPPAAVWEHLIDHERWPEWFRPPDGAPSGGITLEAVVLRRGPADRVGARRDCAASVGPLPWRGRRTLRWTDTVADLHVPWHLEMDIGTRRAWPVRRARLRVILAEAAPGTTRLRLRLSYAPGLLWLVDVLFLRRTVAAGLRQALAGLASRWGVMEGATGRLEEATGQPEGFAPEHPTHDRSGESPAAPAAA